MIEFDRCQFEEYARAVFTTDSPSGCTADAIALIKSYVEELGYTTHVHNKGTLEVDVPGAGRKQDCGDLRARRYAGDDGAQREERRNARPYEGRRADLPDA